MARGTFHGYVVSLTCGMAAVAALGCKEDRPTEPTIQTKNADTPSEEAGLGRLHHIVVIYPENHSFDNLYGIPAR